MFAAHSITAGGEQLYDGRSAILFATVAGVSLGLVTGGAHPPGRGLRAPLRLAVLVRGSVLVLLGLALTTFLAPPMAVILDYYGFAFLLLIGLLFANRLVLAGVAAAVTLVAPAIVGLLTEAVTFEELAGPVQLFGRWLVFGNYPMIVWVAYLLVGLLLARSDLRDRFTAAFALVGGTLAAVVGYSVAAFVPGMSAAAHSDSTLEVIASGGVAVAILGALSLLDSASGPGERVARVVRFVLAPVAAAGAMALTLYVAHAIALTAVRDAFIHVGRWTVPGWVFPALVVGSLLVATLWRRFLGAGPLEAGLRELTRLVVRARPRIGP